MTTRQWLLGFAGWFAAGLALLGLTDSTFATYRSQPDDEGGVTRDSYRAGKTLNNEGPNWNDDVEIVEGARLKQGNSMTGIGSILYRGPWRWMHTLYVSTFSLAIAALFVPFGRRRLLVIGLLGITVYARFLGAFNSYLQQTEQGRVPDGIVFEPALGIYLTLAGFLGLTIVGALNVVERRRTDSVEDRSPVTTHPGVARGG